MSKELEILVLSTDLKFTNSRELDFSIDKIFKMYSNPDYLKEWFWPKLFTNTFKVFEFKNNWDWIFTMHWPDWADYENDCKFLKIIENELIIWEHLCLPNFQAHINFTKLEENKTKLDFTMLFYEKSVFDAVMTFAPEKNEENFDKLENLMGKIYWNN